MVRFTFTKDAEKSFLKLPGDSQERILQKLKDLKNHADIFSVLTRLVHLEPATHRLRVGYYRLILKLETSENHEIEFLVLKVGHRKDIYR
ncbi:MAG: hypothetical protein ACD_28C00419G0003 [uncultured bacterium]|nr:MAG: hypothetical protein ACD_28C00419G0003 [uncultured bacterium]KKT74453.1 MAG: hypothetical protein UW70_C0054G0005 [Candidatus Peregrinibacteria bacterium GW2011_GWA2_44_7]